MPSTSKAQAHFMAAEAHGWHPPGKKPIPKKVAQEFHQADKAKGKWEHPNAAEHKAKLTAALKR